MMQTIYAAHIIIEADTPLRVGSNSSDFWQDSPVQKDWNGLPMILGTSIAGVLRRHYEEMYRDEKLFGFQEGGPDEGEGSRVILSNALLVVDKEGRVEEGLLPKKTKFLSYFDTLPIREHTRIDHRGVTGSTKEYSKFDEEVVYKGTRFKFSIEVLDNKKSFDHLLALLQSPSFRLGGGTTRGFGKLKILEITAQTVDTLEALSTYSSSLNGSRGTRVNLSSENPSSKHSVYVLKIKPDDFFMFGAGFGDKDADQTPVYEKMVNYTKQTLSDRQILIPASSVKGALSHRTAFYYNQATGATIESGLAKTEENNDAVKAIFGHKKELSEDKTTELGQKGKILISDCFKDDRQEAKTFDHVSIDRFTGGAIDGALFQEKTIAQNDEWEIEILLDKDTDEAYVHAFEKALDDVCRGTLPLGGSTTKGHGVFGGALYKDGEVLDVNQ